MSFAHKKITLFQLLFVSVIVAFLASAQAVPHLGDRNFFNDEFYHVEAAQGMLKTGELVQWDFTHNAPRTTDDGDELTYTRSWVYTMQVVAAVQVFGFSEWSARLPSVVWYVLLMMTLSCALLIFTRRLWIALGTTACVLMMTQLIFYAQFVRMYAMVITLSLWGALAAYALLRTVLTPVLLRRRAAIYGILFMLCMYVGYLAHVETILILPGIALATLIEWSRIEYRARTRTEERGVRTRVRLIVCASACIGVVALVSIFITDNVLSDRLGQVRSRFNTPYLLHPFNGFRWPIGALVLWIVYSVVAIRSRSVRFFSVIAAVVIVILLVYVKRYDAERYIIFIVPYIILAFTMSMAYIFKRWPMWGGFALVLWLVVCVPFHISALTPPQSTHWYSFDSAYSAVRLNAAPTDVIYTVDFRSYYWQNDPDRKIIELGHDKVLTLDEFIESVKRNGNGFLILPQGKAHHVRKEIREYCNTHFEHESMNNILIYTIR